ncbi:unnamed protein product, partial [Iphiclides podalirius]
MTDANKTSLRIDWFDGTLIEDIRQNVSSSSQFEDEDSPEMQAQPQNPQEVEKKPIGFKRLMDISQLKPPILNVELSHRPEVAEISALGVREEHTETIRDSFFFELEHLKKDIMVIINQNPKECLPTDCEKSNKDPNNFKNLPIFPTKQDILGVNQVKIQPNIINGTYPSVEHYLDLQFKLLREDCFAPLREGICW